MNGVRSGGQRAREGETEKSLVGTRKTEQRQSLRATGGDGTEGGKKVLGGRAKPLKSILLAFRT